MLEYKCAIGIVVTASHNPKEDNGFKIFWENGAQIISPHAENIYRSILDNLEPWKIYGLNKNLKSFIDLTKKLPSSYFEQSKMEYCWKPKKNMKSKLNVTYTAMHGVGGFWLKQAFEIFSLKPFIPVDSQFEPNPEFPTILFPNPEENGSLVESTKVADLNDSMLILANDPDSDRLQVAEKYNSKWLKFTGNEIAALFADHVWENHSKFNPQTHSTNFIMLASTVSSKYIASMAKKENFLFEDTLTGFKWMGNIASQREKEGKTFLFAYEVEIGFLMGSLNLDKDGVRTSCIFTELANNLYDKGKTCRERLDELYAKYGYFVMENSYFFYKGQEVIINVFTAILNHGAYHKYMGKYKIIRIRDVKRNYDSSEKNMKCLLPCSTSEMVSFYFKNGSVATLRPSGTEEKLKYYIECTDRNSKEEAQKLLKLMQPIFIKKFVQPEKFNLQRSFSLL